MALGKIRYCDAFGTTYKVRTYLVTVQQVNDDGTPATEKPSCRCMADLCPRGLKRLEKFIKRGLTPPAEKQQPGTLPLEAAK